MCGNLIIDVSLTGNVQLKSLVYLFKLMNTFSYTTGMHDLLNNIIVTTFGLQFIYFRDTPARVLLFLELPISLQ
jgi:hypothetical protein